MTKKVTTSFFLFVFLSEKVKNHFFLQFFYFRFSWLVEIGVGACVDVWSLPCVCVK